MAREVDTAQLLAACMLSAFVLYGVGNSLPEHPVGLAMVLLNSVVVCVAGWAGMTALRDATQDVFHVGPMYLFGRIAEGVLLGLGAIAVPIGAPAFAEPLYLAAMCVLGVASVPFWWAIQRTRILPSWLCFWGVGGYAFFATGCLVQLVTGYAAAIMTTPPAGIFELVVAIFLFVFGWQKADAMDARPLLHDEENFMR